MTNTLLFGVYLPARPLHHHKCVAELLWSPNSPFANLQTKEEHYRCFVSFNCWDSQVLTSMSVVKMCVVEVPNRYIVIRIAVVYCGLSHAQKLCTHAISSYNNDTKLSSHYIKFSW